MNHGPVSDSSSGPNDSPMETLNCAFCGKVYTGHRPVPRDALIAHIEECPEHPIGIRLRALTEAIDQTYAYFGACDYARLVDARKKYGTKPKE